MHDVFADRSAVAPGVNDSGLGDLSPIDDAGATRRKLRTDDNELRERFASPGQYSPFGTQFGGGTSPSGWGGGSDSRGDKTWLTPTSFQDWMSSSRRRVGLAGSGADLNQLGSALSDLSLQHNWASSPCGEQWVESRDRRTGSAWSPSQVELMQARMKPNPGTVDTGYRESPPSRPTIGQVRGSPGMPVFPAGTPPKSAAKESPKEAYERLATEQLRQQYLSRILAMQLSGGHASPSSASAPRLPGPFWSPQHPALFGCDPALGNPTALVAGKVPVLIGPAGPVAYDIAAMSPFGVPQLVPAFRPFR